MISNVCSFLLGGLFYILLEMAWRGRSHVSMFITGGFCCMVLAALFLRQEMSWPLRFIVSGLVISSAEFLTGVLVNIRLKKQVWDYRLLPCNLYGQVCLSCSLLWCCMALPIYLLGLYIQTLMNHLSYLCINLL